MASIIIELGCVSGSNADELSKQLQNFIGSVISEKYWGEHTTNRFGPIVFVGALRDPRDGTYSIFAQVWSEHADTLFCIIDEFFQRNGASVKYERIDTK